MHNYNAKMSIITVKSAPTHVTAPPEFLCGALVTVSMR